VAIYDGTNTNQVRRSFVKEFLEKELINQDYQLIWLEIICDDE
jgi:hypothetical protein